MSNETLDYPGDDYVSRLLGTSSQGLSRRNHVENVLNDANSIFSTAPISSTFAQTCGRLTQLFETEHDLGYHVLNLGLQVLRFACDMHESMIENPHLPKSERSEYYRTTASLYTLFMVIFKCCKPYSKLWTDAAGIGIELEVAFQRACYELGREGAEYLQAEFEYAQDQTNEAQSPAPALAVLTPKPDADEVRPSPKPTSVKEKALALLNDKRPTGRTAPLGRAHTMPSLPSSSLTSLNASPRGHDLGALSEETEE